MPPRSLDANSAGDVAAAKRGWGCEGVPEPKPALSQSATQSSLLVGGSTRGRRPPPPPPSEAPQPSRGRGCGERGRRRAGQWQLLVGALGGFAQQRRPVVARDEVATALGAAEQEQPVEQPRVQVKRAPTVLGRARDGARVGFLAARRGGCAAAADGAPRGELAVAVARDEAVAVLELAEQLLPLRERHALPVIGEEQPRLDEADEALVRLDHLGEERGAHHVRAVARGVAWRDGGVDRRAG